MKLLYIFISFLMMTTAFARDAHWEFAGWYGGGCFPNLAFDPNIKDRVYLTSDVAGIWRSDDLGEHWYFVTKGLGQLTVAQVAVAPSDSNVVYAATGAGLYVSKNAGALWMAADNADKTITFVRPENYRAIAIDAHNAKRLCIGTANGKVFCSVNSGKQWKTIDRDFFTDKKPIAALSFDDSDHLMVASTRGLSRCQFEKNACEALGDGPKNISDFLISKKHPNTFYVAADSQLWISKDAGGSWSQPRLVSQGSIYRVSLDESGDSPLIRVIWNKDWKGGVLLTKDEGQTFEEQDDNIDVDAVSNPTHAWTSKAGKANGVHVNPFNSNVLFRTDWWGVFRSDDGGASWHEKIVGAANSVATEVIVDPSGYLYVVSMDNGLLGSHDGGKTYEMLFPKKYDINTVGHLWRVALAGETIIGTSSPWGKILNQVIVSNDQGKNFDLVQSGLPVGRPKQNTMWGQGYPRGLAVDPNNPDIIYLGIDGDDEGGLFISKDRGRTWKRSEGQPGALRIYRALAVDPTNSRRIFWGAAGKGGGVYVSEDGGKKFQYVFKQTQWPFDLTVASDGTIYVAGDSDGAKLFISTTHGQTWNMIGDFGKGRALAAVAVDPANSKRVVVSTVSWDNSAPCLIYLSNDRGQTWEIITGDLPDGSGVSSIAFEPKGKYLYISRYAGSIYKMAL